MVLALVSAVVLSPLYGNSRSDRRYYESKWSSGGFVLPMLLAALIIAIRTTSSSVSSSSSATRPSFLPSPEPSWVLRVGSSSWGLGGFWLCSCLFFTGRPQFKNSFGNRTMKLLYFVLFMWS
ncbi:hypothetical protein ACSQ67_021540 [Phaseolus vulgaris]